jgi:hypothetical protein
VALAAQLCKNDSMRPWKKSYDLALLALYLSVLVGIGLWTLHLRKSELSRPSDEGWQEWRAEAAKEDGTHGPIAREVPRSNERPMLVLMRDDFPAIFGAAIIFPAIILGFFLLVLRGVLRQSGTPHAE